MPRSHSDEAIDKTATVPTEPPRPRGQHASVFAAVILGTFALLVLGLVAILLLSRNGGPATSTATESTAFRSAMRKAEVVADFPSRPVVLASVRAVGSHSFSATLTPHELAALLNAFAFESDVAGIRLQLSDTRIEIPEAGSVKLHTTGTANGAAYGGSVTLPAAFANDRIESPGATALAVEGIPGSAGQRAQVGSALVAHFNAWIAAAPGLRIESARIDVGGFVVEGTAPDRLAYP